MNRQTLQTITLFPLGIGALLGSILYNSSVFVFIGLGLILWASLLMYVTEAKYVGEDVYYSSIRPLWKNLIHVLTDLNHTGKAIYITPIKGELKDTVLIIPSTQTISPVLKIDPDLSSSSIFFNYPTSIRLIPPGLDLALLADKYMGVDNAALNRNNLELSLQKTYVDDLGIVKTLETQITETCIRVRIQDLLWRIERNLVRANNIGSPVISSLACLFAAYIGKPIIIEDIMYQDETLEICYLIDYGGD